ncbi:hypothetical protein ACFIOY_26460 [Bradyrhizobium sp. TZ2]
MSVFAAGASLVGTTWTVVVATALLSRPSLTVTSRTRSAADGFCDVFE